jgi:hypothetical protein
MRRSVVLALSVALIVLVFAPIAAAQTNYRGGGNQGMSSGGMDDIGMDHNNMGMDPNMMASPASSASTTPRCLVLRRRRAPLRARPRAPPQAHRPVHRLVLPHLASALRAVPPPPRRTSCLIPAVFLWRPCCRLGRLSCWRAPASSRPD